MNSGPKIGIALSGGAGRAVAHFAVLDLLNRHGIRPDVVVGCSSGALVAVAYAAGTKEYLLGQFKTITWKKIWRLVSWRKARGGVFHLHGADSEFAKLTGGRRFEDLPIKVGVTAADIETGHLTTITTGDITQALKATVAIPGIFEPVNINNRILLEGGLVNIVPTIPTRQLGADIVIGVDVAKTKFFFQKKLPLFRLIRKLRRILGIHFVGNGIIKPLTSHILDRIEKQFGFKKRRMPSALRIFFWAVDRSYDVEAEWNEENQACDIMIRPDVKRTPKLELGQAEYIYQQGYAAATEALPRIKELIYEFENRK